MLYGQKCYLNSSRRKHDALLGLSWDDSGTQKYCSNRIVLHLSLVKIVQLVFSNCSLGRFRLEVKSTW